MQKKSKIQKRTKPYIGSSQPLLSSMLLSSLLLSPFNPEWPLPSLLVALASSRCHWWIRFRTRFDSKHEPFSIMATFFAPHQADHHLGPTLLTSPLLVLLPSAGTSAICNNASTPDMSLSQNPLSCSRPRLDLSHLHLGHNRCSDLH